MELWRQPSGSTETMLPLGARYAVASRRKDIAVLAYKGPLGVWTRKRVPPRQLKGGLSRRREAARWIRARMRDEERERGLRRSQRPTVQEDRRRARRRVARWSMSVAT